MPYLKPIYDPLEEMYLARLSIRRIAALLKRAKTGVAKHVKALGISRPQTYYGDSVRGLWLKPASRHGRTTRYRARRLMGTHIGRKLSRCEHVHHKDGDCTNNHLANLEIKSASEHISEHARGLEYRTPRHLRPKRREYMKRYLNAYYIAHKKGGE